MRGGEEVSLGLGGRGVDMHIEEMREAGGGSHIEG
jgi:hypothetical protein